MPSQFKDFEQDQISTNLRIVNSNFFKKIVIILFIVIGFFGFYLGIVYFYRYTTKLKISSKLEECNQNLIKFNQEFLSVDFNCNFKNPDLAKTWNIFTIKSDSENLINEIEIGYNQHKQNFQTRVSEYEKAKKSFETKYQYLKDLGYKSMPDLEAIKNLEPKNSEQEFYLKIQEFYQNQEQNLNQPLDLYKTLFKYKLDKFNSRILAAQKLNVELPQEALNITQKYNLSSDLMSDLTDLKNAEEMAKLSNNLTLATSKIMQAIYPKAHESKENSRIIDINDIPENSVNFPILMYHRIESLEKIPKEDRNKSRLDLTVSPEVFTAQLDKIKEAGFETVNMHDLEKAIRTNDKEFFNSKKILLTFDDGYPEHYDIAFKELQKRQMKAVFAIVTSKISDENDTINLSWKKLKEMQENDMEIISHTVSHCALGSYRFFDGRTLKEDGEYRKCDLSNPAETNYGKVGFEMMPINQAEFEIAESKKEIENRLNTSESFIILPYGAYNDITFDLLWQNGYTLGLGVGGGPKLNLNNPFTLNRITVIGQQDNNELKGWFKNLKN